MYFNYGVNYLFYKTFTNNVFRTQVNKWFYDHKGDGIGKTVQHDELHDHSVVFEIGGYTGGFSEVIIKKYNPFVYIFEPVQAYYDVLVEKFSRNPKVKIFHCGLGGETKSQEIFLNNDGSSLVEQEKLNAKQIQVIKIKKFSDFLKEQAVEHIDLLQINIEGAEYELFDDILNNTDMSLYGGIQVQFHDFTPESPRQRQAILDRLQLTHEEIYSYPFVWEFFRLIKN